MKTVYEIRTPDLSGIFIGFDWFNEAAAYWKEHVKNAPPTYRMHGAVIVEHTWEMPHEAEKARFNWLAFRLEQVGWSGVEMEIESIRDAGRDDFGASLREAIDGLRKAPASTEKVIPAE